MDIRFNPNINNRISSGRVKDGAGKEKAFFNITDKIGSVVDTKVGYEKPIVKNKQTAETAMNTETLKNAEPASPGMTSVPGPSAAVVSKQIEQLGKIGVKFLKKRFIPLPFIGGKALSADEAAGILTGADESAKGELLVQTTKGDQVPLNSLEDLKEVSFFKGLSSEKPVNNEMAEFLRYGGSIGLTFNSGGRKDVGEYGAYNLLSEGWAKAGENAAPVELVRNGTGILTIKPDQAFDPKAAKNELETAWAAFDKVVSFEDGKIKGNKYLKALNKPLYDMTFLEKFNAMDHMDPHCVRALENYNIVADKAKNKAEFLDVVDILDKQELIGYRKTPEFTKTDVKKMMDGKGQATPRQKSEVLRGIRKSIGIIDEYRPYQSSHVNECFDLIPGHCRDAAEFMKLSKLYIEMSKAFYTKNSFNSGKLSDEVKNSKKAFVYMAENLKGNVTDSTAFIDFLRVNGNVDESIARFSLVQSPVKNEDINTRVETSHILADSKHFNQYYQVVLESLNPGDNALDCANFMKTIEQAYEPDPLNGKKIYVDSKNLANMNKANINDLRELVGFMSSGFETYREAVEELKKPVAGETFRNRKDVLADLRKNYLEKYPTDRDKYNNDHNAIEDYKTITEHIVEGESLDMAANRFQMLFDKLEGRKNSQEVRDAYMVLSEGIKQGGANIARDVIQKAIIEGKDIDDIRTRIKDGIRETVKDIKRDGKKIVDGDDSVIIGGVQLEKKRFDNLLKVLNS